MVDENKLKEKFLEENYDVLRFVTKTTNKKEISTMKTDEFVVLVKDFVNNFSINERWRDFRWWCTKKGITPFEENKDEGIILPKIMWTVKFD